MKYQCAALLALTLAFSAACSYSPPVPANADSSSDEAYAATLDKLHRINELNRLRETQNGDGTDPLSTAPTIQPLAQTQPPSPPANNATPPAAAAPATPAAVTPAAPVVPELDHDATKKAGSAFLAIRTSENNTTTTTLPVSTVGDCVELAVGAASVNFATAAAVCRDSNNKTLARITCESWQFTKTENGREVKTNFVKCFRPGTKDKEFSIGK